MMRVLLVDDQQLFVENLKFVLETLSSEIEVTGIARNGNEAVALAAKDNPDIILMDVRMPIMDGVEATRVIHKDSPDVKIIILTAFDDDDDHVHRALRYGASGYLLKNIPSEELFASLRAVTTGAFTISPSIARKLAGNSDEGRSSAAGSPRWLEFLTRREKDVLSLVSKGYHNKKIADTLYISEPTVKNYVSSIYSKLETSDRFQVMKMANEVGFQNLSDS